MEENNKELIKIKEELENLDTDYFHTCVKIDENNNIKWSVFYKNMNDEDFFKINNRPILNSINNDLSDIEKLNEKFEEIKEKAKENMYFEKFNLSFDMFKFQRNIYDELYKMFEIPGYSIMSFVIILFLLSIIFKLDNRIFAAVGISLMTIYAILSLTITYIRDNAEAYINDLHKKEEDRMIKAYLKDKDMKGLKYEFTKKNREKFIEKNKEYRPKRKRI